MSSHALDRQSPMPLWAQLEADLDRRLKNGEFDDGQFPTDLDLTKTYGVSRHTVREAVRQLNKTGLLTRERGRGTVLNRPVFEQSLGTLYSLFQSVESAGVEQRSEVLALEITTDENAASHLELDAETPLVFLSRLRFAGGSPLAIDRAWLPAAIAEALLEIDWSHTALYEELTAIGAPVPDQGWERLTPVMPSEQDRIRLGMPAGEAAFCLQRVGRRDGVVIEWRTTLLSGVRYQFASEWSVGELSQLKPTAL